MQRINLKSLVAGLVVLAAAACTSSGPTTPAAVSSATPMPSLAASPTLPPASSTPTGLSLPVVSMPQIDRLIMLDSQNGWALTDSAILRTIDGGKTWYQVTPSGVTSVGGFVSLYDPNASTSWVDIPNSDGTSGTLYHTNDGGVTWTSTAAPFANGSLSFPDATNGWAMVSLGAGMSHEAVAIYRTSDGGSTWKQVFTDDPTAADTSDTLPFVGDKTGLTSTDASHAWVTGAEPVSDFIYLYSTADGGVSWTNPTLTIPAVYSNGMTNALPPFFFGTTGVLPVSLVANTSAFDFYLSQDGGQTWSATTPVAANGEISVASADDFYVWDGGASLFASHDAGTSWTTVTPNISIQNTLDSLQFVSATTGWATTSDANSHHSLYLTTDGGTTWTTLIP